MSLTRDKILSKDSVKDLFALFFSISSLNRVALDGNSLPIFSAAICDVFFISPIWTWTFSFSSCKHLRKEITNSFSHCSFLDFNFWTSSQIVACSWLVNVVRCFWSSSLVLEEFIPIKKKKRPENTHTTWQLGGGVNTFRSLSLSYVLSRPL